jgi:hypothetical protein
MKNKSSRKEDMSMYKDDIVPILDEIAEKVHTNHASVMVGAGFSKNTGAHFPTWAELGDIFCKKVYPQKQSDTDGKTKDEIKHKSVLKLAELVEVQFGRPRLHKLIQDEIPDRKVSPSPLHVKLLELPWTDVFTTNYDTLLERATTSVNFRKYDVVVNNEDILNSERPRIIKLHGSFPSHYPFIITEEDYRRYPQNYAPFVNTVQQSMLENAFCLIGFSGDDPNFLQWIGWIRDNLGKTSGHKMYLIGLFNFSDAEKKYFSRRNIIVVDLAAWSQAEGNHYKAIDDFCQYLLNKKTLYSGLDWPTKQAHEPTQSKVQDKAHRIRNLIDKWKETRNNYPGWCVTPQGEREHLWIYTNQSMNYISPGDDLPDLLDIKYMYELVWRLERCLCPLINNVNVVLESVLRRYWPYPCSAHQGINSILPSTSTETCRIDWDDLRAIWQHLALSLLRYYREQGLLQEWQEWDKRIATIYDYLSSDQKSLLHYERVLFCMFRLDIDEAQKQLIEWPTDNSLPFMEAKRASIMAELGDMEAAEQILTRSLEELRRQLNLAPIKGDYTIVSQESYIIFLRMYYIRIRQIYGKEPQANEIEDVKELYIKRQEEESKSIRQHDEAQEPENSIPPQRESISTQTSWEDLYNNRMGTKKKEWREFINAWQYEKNERELQRYKERLNILRAYKCDPLYEWNIYKIQIEKQPVYIPSISKIKSFDIGRISRTDDLRGEDKAALSAYEFLLFCEDAGIPFRMGKAIFGAQIASGTLKRIYRYSPYWALATLVRIGDGKAVDEIFNRESLHSLSIEQVDGLVNQYITALRRSKVLLGNQQETSSHQYAVQLTNILPEILSRLCCKCSLDAKEQLLSILLELYECPNTNPYSGIRNLLERLLKSYSPWHQVELIPKVLAFPIPANFNPISANEFRNPFIFLDLDPDYVKDHHQIAVDENLIERTFNDGDFDNPSYRRWALFTLVRLYQFGLISRKQSLKLRDTLYSIRDDFGFPKGTDFYKFAFFDLPRPKSFDLNESFKRYIHKTRFPKQGNSNTFSFSNEDSTLFRELLNCPSSIPWTKDEIIEIFDRLMECWDTDKNQLKKERQYDIMSINQGFIQRFIMLTKVVAEFIIPKMEDNIDDRERKELYRLIKELDEHGVFSLRVKAACVRVSHDSKQNVIREILRTLRSYEHEEVIYCLETIMMICNLYKREFNKRDRTTLLLHIAQKICWRHERGLSSALNTMSHLLRKHIDLITPQIELLLIEGLDNLYRETNYKSGLEQWDFFDKLEIRRAAVCLAYELYAWHLRSGTEIPNEVLLWHSVSQSEDEFAEVKNQWPE